MNFLVLTIIVFSTTFARSINAEVDQEGLDMENDLKAFLDKNNNGKPAAAIDAATMQKMKAYILEKTCDMVGKMEKTTNADSHFNDFLRIVREICETKSAGAEIEPETREQMKKAIKLYLAEEGTSLKEQLEKLDGMIRQKALAECTGLNVETLFQSCTLAQEKLKMVERQFSGVMQSAMQKIQQLDIQGKMRYLSALKTMTTNAAGHTLLVPSKVYASFRELWMSSPKQNQGLLQQRRKKRNADTLMLALIVMVVLLAMTPVAKALFVGAAFKMFAIPIVIMVFFLLLSAL